MKIGRATGVCGVGSSNALRDRLLTAGHEDLAAGVDRHNITTLDHARELLDGAYGWETADQSSDLASIRSLIRIMDACARPSDADLLHWL